MRGLSALGRLERIQLGRSLPSVPSVRHWPQHNRLTSSPVHLRFHPRALLRPARCTPYITARQSHQHLSSPSSPRAADPRRVIRAAPARYSTSRDPTQSRQTLVLLLLSLVSLVGVAGTTLHLSQNTEARSNLVDKLPAAEPLDMAAEIPPGRPGNLTPEQEEKLRKLWAAIFQVCGVSDDDSDAAENTNPSTVAEKGPQKSDLGKSEKPKKKRLGMFSRKGNKDTDAESVSSVAASGALTPKEGEDDKYGQTKHFFDTLASQSPETIRATIWSMVKHDHPDALVLRFLRARKWDIEKALVMLVSTMSWRSKDMHVDDDIMKNGEGAAVEAENSGEGEAKKLGHDFMAQIRMGKSFLHGVDKTGRPICVVRVRLHHQGEQCEESLERYTVYIIETARMLLRPPVDTAVSPTTIPTSRLPMSLPTGLIKLARLLFLI